MKNTLLILKINHKGLRFLFASVFGFYFIITLIWPQNV